MSKRRPSTQTSKFNQTATADIPRSSFDLSHGLKTTFNCDDLVPILNIECLPGDSISCRASIFARMATPLKPLLDNLHCETFFFFTPTRQVWENWIRMHGEQDDPADSIDFVVPTFNGAAPVAEGELLDHYALPIGLIPDVTPVNCLPIRCYQHIYNNWFRDQNIVGKREWLNDDGPDTYNPSNQHRINKRRKKKDYFTSCLPWPQKHQDVTVSLGERADVVGIGFTGTPTSSALGTMTESTGPRPTVTGFSQATDLVVAMEANPDQPTWPNIYADLSGATGISINDLRESIQIQRLLERDARSGSRYPELLKAHFGVTDPSMMVHQRPLFLGGGHTMVSINPIAQTSAAEYGGGPATTPQGNLAAIGTIAATGHGFTYSATEHGYITGIINVRPDLTYQEGLERYWSRSTRFDFFYPALGHLGEMAVLNQEIHHVANDPETNLKVFGYQEAWADYRYIPSKITGLFRSVSAASLDVWHLAQDFANTPALNPTFINYATPMERVVAVPTEPDFLMDAYFKIKAARPLPLYGTPGMMDHF